MLSDTQQDGYLRSQCVDTVTRHSVWCEPAVWYLRVFKADVAVRNQPLLPLVQPLPPVLRHAVVHQQGVVFLEGQLPPGPPLKVIQRYSLKDLCICSKQKASHCWIVTYVSTLNKKASFSYIGRTFMWSLNTLISYKF